MDMDEIDYRLSEVFEALGNAVRLKLIILLEESSHTVSELSEELEKPMQTVSRHLKKLRDKDLVQAESEGNSRLYKVKNPELIRRCLELRSLLRRDEDT